MVFLHRDDIAALGFDNGDIVDLFTLWDGDERVRCALNFRIVEYDVPRGSAAAYYPETNTLVPLDSTALHSNCPTYKSVVISLAPAGTRDHTCPDVQSQEPVGSDWTHKSHPAPEHLS